jgi:hypothetical protein
MSNIYALFIALIILTCVILVLILILMFHFFISRYQKRRTLTNPPLESGLAIQKIPHTGVLQPDYNGHERLSHLTTAAPSIELLPEIRTSSERAEDWLERRESRIVEHVLGTKNGQVSNGRKEVLRPDWRGVQDENGVAERREEVIDEQEKGQYEREDSVVLDKT